jgi:hypothetical protein
MVANTLNHYTHRYRHTALIIRQYARTRALRMRGTAMALTNAVISKDKVPQVDRAREYQ